MATRTIIGEVDHPEDREETLLSQAAVTLLSYEFNGDYLDCEFGILSTPCGHIVKDLCDCGIILGVSSRGNGDTETNSDGVDVVIPDSYEFEAFDIVKTPAVKGARQEITESLSKNPDRAKRLCESMKKIVESTDSTPTLQLVKNILDSTDVPDAESIKDSINKKIDETESRGTTLEDGLIKDLEAATNEVERLNGEVTELTNKLSAGTTGVNELEEKLTKSNENANYLCSRLASYKNNLRSHKETVKSLTEATDKIDSLTSKLEESRLKSARMVKDLCESKSKVDRLQESANRYAKLALSNKKLIEGYKSKIDELTKLNESLKLSRSQVSDLKSSNLKESKRREYQERKANLFTEAYIRSRCKYYGIDQSSLSSRINDSSTPEEIDKLLESMRGQKDRISRMPISLSGSKILVESLSHESTPESDEMNQFEDILVHTKDHL